MQSNSAVMETVKHAPPAGWLIAFIAGLHLDTWVTVLSFVWVAWLLLDKVNDRYIKPWRAKRAKPAA